MFKPYDQMDTWDAISTSGNNAPNSKKVRTAVKNWLNPNRNVKGEPKTKTIGSAIDSSPGTDFTGHESRESGTQTTKKNIFGTKVTRTQYDAGTKAVFKERKSGKKVLKIKNEKVNIADDMSKGHMLGKTKIVKKYKDQTVSDLKDLGVTASSITTKSKTKFKKGTVARTKKKEKGTEISTSYEQGTKPLGYITKRKDMTKWTKGGYQRRSATSEDKAKGNIKKTKSKWHIDFDSSKGGFQHDDINKATTVKKYK